MPAEPMPYYVMPAAGDLTLIHESSWQQEVSKWPDRASICCGELGFSTPTGVDF